MYEEASEVTATDAGHSIELSVRGIPNIVKVAVSSEPESWQVVI